MCAVFAIVPSSERLESVLLAQAFMSVDLRTQAKRIKLNGWRNVIFISKL